MEWHMIEDEMETIKRFNNSIDTNSDSLKQLIEIATKMNESQDRLNAMLRRILDRMQS